MMIPQLFMVPERTRRVLSNSVNEIKSLSNQLTSKPEELIEQSSIASQVGEYVCLPILLEDVVNQKQIEYCQQYLIKINFKNETNNSQIYAKVSSVDLRSVLSNLVNNAIESYGANGGSVRLTLAATDRSCFISVIDNGIGMTSEEITKLGSTQYSSKSGIDRGLGIQHAFKIIESYQGRLKIKSALGEGSKFTIELPLPERSSILQKIRESVAW